MGKTHKTHSATAIHCSGLLALSYGVQRDIERQPFIPPPGLRYANCEFPDLTS